jgi:clan AA aspartic protease (TIGR02281 family)
MKQILKIVLAAAVLAAQPLSAQSDADYNYRKAIEILEDDGDTDKARELLKDNLKDYPKHIDTYLLLARIERVDRDYSSALRLINVALNNNHKGSGVSDAKLMWWKSAVYEDVADYETSVEIMEEAVKMARKQDREVLPQMLEKMAHLYYRVNRCDESDAVYREILKEDESSLPARVGLARNMISRKQYSQALATLEECRRYDRDYYEIYRFQMQAYDGLKEYRKMIDSMITLYEKSDNYDCLDVEVFKRDRKYAVAVIRQKIASVKDNTPWRLLLAEFYGECYMYSEVLPLVDGLIEEYGYDDVLLEMRAGSYDQLGLTDLALADIDRTLEICKDNDRAYYHGLRGDVLRSAGRYEEAVADYTVYIDRYPTDAYGYYARGWSKELAKDLAGALEDYDEGIAVDQSYPYIYLMRGKIHQANGNVGQAESDFEIVLAKDTVVNYASCRHYALYHLGRNEEALEWMDKMIEDDPEDPGNWYDKACLMSLMGRHDEAVQALTASFEKGFRSIPHVDNDDDMDPIRDREDFRNLLEKYRHIYEEEISKMEKKHQTEEPCVVSEIALKRMYGGTYEVPCHVNGLPLKMVFDTGAADVTISSVEASFMLKNGYLADADIKGKQNYVTASGDIHEGTVLRLKEVKLGDAVLKNIEASVVHSQKAPLLLGQSVLEKFGTITIDNVNSRLLIRQ